VLLAIQSRVPSSPLEHAAQIVTSSSLSSHSRCPQHLTYPLTSSVSFVSTCNTPLIHFSATNDYLVIAIPWKLLWVVKRSRKEKLAIGSIVGLGVLIILFAVIRIIVTNTTHTHPEPVWLALWSAIETSVAVVVISLTSLKVFFTKSGTSSNARSGYLQKPGQNYSERYGGRGAATVGPIPGTPIELGDTAGSRGDFRSFNGEVRKASTSNESEEILVHAGPKNWSRSNS